MDREGEREGERVQSKERKQSNAKRGFCLCHSKHTYKKYHSELSHPRKASENWGALVAGGT